MPIYKLVFISCPIQILLSCAKLYDTRRISGKQATGYLPMARESYDGLHLQGGKFCHCCAGRQVRPHVIQVSQIVACQDLCAKLSRQGAVDVRLPQI